MSGLDSVSEYEWYYQLAAPAARGPPHLGQHVGAAERSAAHLHHRVHHHPLLRDIQGTWAEEYRQEIIVNQ